MQQVLFPSPFKDAAVLTMDGVGEYATTTISFGHDNKIKIQKEINFPHSLGLLIQLSLITQVLRSTLVNIK